MIGRPKIFCLGDMLHKFNWNMPSLVSYAWRKLSFMIPESQLAGNSLCMIANSSFYCVKLTSNMIHETKIRIGREGKEIGLLYMGHLSKHGMITYNTCTRMMQVILKCCSNLYT